MIIDQFCNLAISEHAKARYPEEACGVIIAGVYHECRNVHETPTEHFKLDGAEQFDLIQKFGEVQAIIHSHPFIKATQYRRGSDPAWASLGDQRGFLLGNVPWGIVSCDGSSTSEVNWLDDAETKPLLSRPFSWFTADCYTLVRDWHRINTKITIPNFEREWAFWEKRQNIIEEGMRTIPQAVIIPKSQAQVGDTAIFDTFGRGIVNHLGVICGNNQMIHQWAGKFSEISRWDQWANKAKYVVRLDLTR